MSTVEDQKLLKKMDKEDKRIQERNERVESGVGSQYDIRMYNKMQNALIRRLTEEQKEEAAKKRENEHFNTLRQPRQRMGQGYGADHGGDDSMWMDDDFPVAAERVEQVFDRFTTPKRSRRSNSG